MLQHAPPAARSKVTAVSLCCRAMAPTVLSGQPSTRIIYCSDTNHYQCIFKQRICFRTKIITERGVLYHTITTTTGMVKCGIHLCVASLNITFYTRSYHVDLKKPNDYLIQHICTGLYTVYVKHKVRLRILSTRLKCKFHSYF